MDPIPDLITHNFDPARGALHNICELSERQAELVLGDIRASGTRSIKANYLQRRRAVENWLIAECRRKLGPTHLQRPRYFFLGNFADGRDRSRPESLVIPLAAFSPDTIAFTYPDNMASLALGRPRSDSTVLSRSGIHLTGDPRRRSEIWDA